METYIIEVKIPAESIHEAIEHIHTIKGVTYRVKLGGLNEQLRKGKTSEPRTD